MQFLKSFKWLFTSPSSVLSAARTFPLTMSPSTTSVISGVLCPALNISRNLSLSANNPFRLRYLFEAVWGPHPYFCPVVFWSKRRRGSYRAKCTEVGTTEDSIMVMIIAEENIMTEFVQVLRFQTSTGRDPTGSSDLTKIRLASTRLSPRVWWLGPS